MLDRGRAVQVTSFLMRVVAGILFIQTGSIKLFGWFGGMPGGATAHFISELWVAAVLEFFGGIAVALGLFTRPIAFILSGEMAVAYWQVHAARGPWPPQNQGMAAVLLCFVYLFLSAYGAGKWSLDEILARKGKGEQHQKSSSV